MTNPFFEDPIPPQPESTAIVAMQMELSVPPDIITQIDLVAHELKTVGAIKAQEDVQRANTIIKKAKTIINKVEAERKSLTVILDDYKKKAIAKEKEVTSVLVTLTESLNKSIIEFQKEQDRLERERLAEIARKKAEEQAKIEAERKAKELHLNNATALKNGILQAYNTATLANIDALIERINTVPVMSEAYGEHCPEVQAFIMEYRPKFQTKKSELIQMSELEQKNKAEAERIKAEQQVKAQAEAERIRAEQEAQKAKLELDQANALANAQMESELQEAQALTTKSGTRKVWKFNPDTVDMSLLPNEFKTFDEKKIKEAISQGARNIPGVHIYQDIQNVAR